MSAEENEGGGKKDKPSGFWAWLKNFKLLLGVVLTILGFFGVKSLSSCAGSSSETKGAASATSVSAATANPSATTSPTQTQSQTVIIPPPVLPPPSPHGHGAASQQKSGDYGISIGTNNGQVNGPGAHDNTMHVEGADKEEVRRLQKQLEYSEMATLNIVGTTGRTRPPLVEHSSLIDALAQAVDIVNDQATYRCDDRSIAILREVAEKFPKFPFSYWALADCLRKSGDEAWKGYAGKAIEILRYTTTIENRHRNHDEVLKQLQAALHAK